MNFSDYQQAAHTFATYGGNPMYPFLGLSEEAGEVLGKMAKFIRKHEGIDLVKAQQWVSLEPAVVEAKEAITKEIGDVLWMLAECATLLGINLADAAKGNIDKLTDRKERGVIVGEGDNR